MKKPQNLLLIATLFAVALAVTACSKTVTTTSNTNTTTTTTSNSQPTNAANTSTANSNPTTPTATGGSPSAAMKVSFDALKKRDVAAFKKTVSSEDLKEMEAELTKNGQNLDEFLKEMMELPDSNLPDTLETRNEKIDGDKATVEYKTKDGSWKTGRLVKEGGEWKMKQGSGGDDAHSTTGKDSGGMDGNHDK